MTKEKIENKLFWHYLSGGVLALIWICIEIDIYPVRNTDEYYLGGYNQLSCLCLIILGILVYKDHLFEETIKKSTVVHRA
ncbi:hypothetical protein DW760_01585 [Coprobacillus sp. AM29-13]|nr:hypothetical protein DWX48_08940 [Coprobacillus sp. AF19-3]RHT54626.1 hypothetical protein DW760_01585 [Coprobacillus sp. AM29-13]